MKSAITLFCSIIILLFINSCKKGVSNIDIGAMEKCNSELNLDTTGIANKLIGKWKWKSSYCGECTDPGTHRITKTVIATFTSARTFSVTENSTVVAQGNWNLRIVDSNNKWGLQSDSSLYCLYGYILFCGNEVVFADSYIDGADNLFYREN